MISNKKGSKLNKEFSLKDTMNRQTESPGEDFFIDKVNKEVSREVDRMESEQKGEKKEESVVKSIESREQEVEKLKKIRTVSPVATKLSDIEELEIKKVENILQEGLEETYKKMDPVLQAQFKAQGEDTARAINLLINKAKVKIKEIVDLVIKWLKLIPGVNRFFIEQEAKIKADKLMEEKRKRAIESKN